MRIKNGENFWIEFREWLNKRYSKCWSKNVFSYAKRYHWMINGSLRELYSFSSYERNNILKSLIALSKYIGCYGEFKSKIKNYGLKWEQQSSFESFLRMMKAKEDLIDWVKQCMEVLDNNSAAFIKFVAISGLRKTEALRSFNLIIQLSKEGGLNKYYDSELQALQHFKFEKYFLRRTKNTFITFVPKKFIEDISKCRQISDTSLKRRLRERDLRSRLNELRDYFATFMIHNGLIKEEVDILQGRVGKSIFMRHYFSPAIRDLRDRTLSAIDKMVSSLKL